MRTCFSRELKAQKSVKSGQAAPKRRQYVYFERLLFLIPCMESRPTEGSIESSESNQDDAILTQPQSHPQRKRRTKQSDYDDQILKALQSNEDDDTNYCLSLVPFMKELTSDEKLEVRIRILQTFKEIKYSRHQPSLSQHPTQSQQQSITMQQDTSSYLHLSTSSPESQTPPPQHLSPSPHSDTIHSYWSNYSEPSESELIDL